MLCHLSVLVSALADHKHYPWDAVDLVCSQNRVYVSVKKQHKRVYVTNCAGFYMIYNDNLHGDPIKLGVCDDVIKRIDNYLNDYLG